MVYRVEVGLEADLKGFIPEIGAAIAITEKFDHTVEGLDRSLNKLPLDSAKAAASMRLLSGDVNEFGNRVTQIGNKSAAMSIVDQRIRTTRSEIRKLMDDFAKTGDLDIFRKLQGKQGDLSALTNIRKKISNQIEDAAKDGMTFLERAVGDAFNNGIRGAFTNPYVLGAAVALGIAVAAPIGAALGGLVIAAAAIGAVAGGVAGAAKFNPKAVGDAWHNQIEQIKSEWLNASRDFVKPTIEAIHILGGAVKDVHIGDMLEKAAKFVVPLADGFAGLIRGIGGGFSALIDKAGPIIKVLRDEMPLLGARIEQSLSLIAGGNKGAADGLKTILDWTGKVIVGVGMTIRLFEDMYHAITRIADAVDSVTKFTGAGFLAHLVKPSDTDNLKAYAVSLDGLPHGLDKTKDAAEAAQESLSKLDSQLNKTTLSTDTLAASMVKKIFTASMNLDQALLSVHDSLNQVRDAFHENGKAIDTYSAKGISNRRVVLGAVQANMELYQAQIAAGASATDAAADYDANTAALEKQLRKAHLTQGEIDGLIGKYKKVPANVNTAIAMQGLTDAINGLANLIRLINGIKSKDVYVRVHQTLFNETTGRRVTGSSRNPNDGAKGAIRMQEGGALVAPSNPGTFLFAEPQTGGEAFIPLRGITQSRAMGLAQVVGNNYGFDVRARDEYLRPQIVVAPPMQRFEELFVWMWRRLDQAGAFSK